MTYWHGLIFGGIAWVVGLVGFQKISKDNPLWFVSLLFFVGGMAFATMAIWHLFIIRR